MKRKGIKEETSQAYKVFFKKVSLSCAIIESDRITELEGLLDSSIVSRNVHKCGHCGKIGKTSADFNTRMSCGGDCNCNYNCNCSHPLRCSKDCTGPTMKECSVCDKTKCSDHVKPCRDCGNDTCLTCDWNRNRDYPLVCRNCVARCILCEEVAYTKFNHLVNTTTLLCAKCYTNHVRTPEQQKE